MQERHKHADRKHQGSIDEHAERQQQQQHAQERHNNLDLQHEARVRSLDGLVCGTERMSFPELPPLGSVAS